MDTMEIPWPRKGDKLLALGTDWWHNACLNYLGDDDHHLYREGYKLAARILVDKAMEDRAGLDALIYPIMFVYRHHLELSLKEIISTGSALLRMERFEPRGHGLWGLWQECRQILEQVWPHGHKDDLDAVEECIRELDQRDSTSQSFRYSTTTQGHRPLSGITRINVRNVAEVIERILGFLGGCGIALEEYYSIRCQLDCGSE